MRPANSATGGELRCLPHGMPWCGPLLHMRIEGEPEQALTEVWISLTRDEASRLHAALDAMLDDDVNDPDWHAHVTSGDESCELTLGLQADA